MLSVPAGKLWRETSAEKKKKKQKKKKKLKKEGAEIMLPPPRLLSLSLCVCRSLSVGLDDVWLQRPHVGRVMD